MLLKFWHLFLGLTKNNLKIFLVDFCLDGNDAVTILCVLEVSPAKCCGFNPGLDLPALILIIRMGCSRRHEKATDNRRICPP